MSASTVSTPLTAATLSPRWFNAHGADRLLGLFAVVEPGEGTGALLLSLNVFLLLAAYYLLKTVREVFVLTEGGAEVKAYSAAGQALLLLLVVPIYGWLGRHLVRFRLIAFVNLFFVANLLGFYFASFSGWQIGVAFYLWLGIFNVMTVAQFWSFANDLYSEEAGKRLFPVLGIGSSLGALAGAKAAGSFFAALGIDQLLLLAGSLLLMSLALSWWVNRRACDSCPVQRMNAAAPTGVQNGFTLVSHSRYLRLIAIMVMLVNVVNTGGEFLLSKLVLQEAANAGIAGIKAQEAFIGHFYGEYFTWVGVLGLLFQLFLVSRLFKWIGVRGALFLLPTIALGAYSVLAALPALSVAFTGKVCENAADYSVENTAKHALFLPLSRDVKYQAKTAIDTFFFRAGDMSQAGIVWLGSLWAFTPRHFALLNVTLVATLIGVVTILARSKPVAD